MFAVFQLNKRDKSEKLLTKIVGKKEHAAELGNAIPTKPLLFSKPVSSYISEGETIKIPEGCTNLQHEIELGLVIGKRAQKISKTNAMDYVAGYALALDMTARDFQELAKKQGNPWLLAKGFDTSCPVSDFIDKSRIADPYDLTLWCKVNGLLKQKGSTSQMIFDFPTILFYITKFITLEPGDLVLTGTPSGVSTVKSGDEITCGIENIVEMKFTIE
uniref:Oxaloacetate tautomerase FAHD1, mitochondrial n=1 Tax=Romanomermis culicivorax TaxID=13658 RepID=A0A915J9D3_ROMCU